MRKRNSFTIRQFVWICSMLSFHIRRLWENWNRNFLIRKNLGRWLTDWQLREMNDFSRSKLFNKFPLQTVAVETRIVIHPNRKFLLHCSVYFLRKNGKIKTFFGNLRSERLYFKSKTELLREVINLHAVALKFYCCHAWVMRTATCDWWCHKADYLFSSEGSELVS